MTDSAEAEIRAIVQAGLDTISNAATAAKDALITTGDKRIAAATSAAPDIEVEALARRQVTGEASYWSRFMPAHPNAKLAFDEMTGDNQQAVCEGIRWVLASLTSTGRLVPAGGMPLTAEQAEDVVAQLSADKVFRLSNGAVIPEILRLRKTFGIKRCRCGKLETAAAEGCEWHSARTALFSATEPAEAACKTREEMLGEKVEHLQAQVKHLSRVAVNAAEHGVPAPAVPAEEETKAEVVTAERLAELIADAPAANYEENDYNAGYVAALLSLRDELAEVAKPAAEDSRPVTFEEIAKSLKDFGDAESTFGFKLNYWGKIAEKLIAKYPHLTSSPVVPAPTETGPWQTWQEVPDEVPYRSSLWTLGPAWFNRDNNRYVQTSAHTPDGTSYISGVDDDDMNTNLALFVAVEEGDA